MFSLLLALALPAHAQDNLAEEAHRRMKLSFDLDEVEEMIEAPAPAAPPRPGRVAQAALPLEPNSKVEQVTVFRDWALVTRQQTLRLSAGTASVTFEGLPPGLDGGSLNAAVNTGRARVVGVELVSGLDLARDEARREAIRAEMRPMAEELGAVQDRIEALLARQYYLRTTLLSAPGGDRPQPSLQELRATADYLGAAEETLAAALRAEEERARELDEDLGPLLIELRDPLATGQRVRVDLELDAAAEVKVDLRYQVAGAGWSPAYRARLSPDSGEVQLEYVAVVSQATGELWDDTALSLSSAAPWVSGDLPQLYTWTLENGGDLLSAGGQVTGPLVDHRQGAGGGGLLRSDMSARSEGGGIGVIGVPGRRDVAGDGSAQRIPLGSRTFAGELQLATVPRAVPQVHRTLRFAYEADAPLLPGSVATYVGSEYVGSASLGSVLPGETVELGFGADDRIRVARELVSRDRESVGLGRRSSRWTFHYRISLHNLSDQVRVVDVRDQVPVSADDRVSVKVVQATGIVEALANDPQGMARWSLELSPGEVETVELEFTVTAPTNSEAVRAMEMMMM